MRTNMQFRNMYVCVLCSLYLIAWFTLKQLYERHQNNITFSSKIHIILYECAVVVRVVVVE